MFWLLPGYYNVSFIKVYWRKCPHLPQQCKLSYFFQKCNACVKFRTGLIQCNGKALTCWRTSRRRGRGVCWWCIIITVIVNIISIKMVILCIVIILQWRGQHKLLQNQLEEREVHLQYQRVRGVETWDTFRPNIVSFLVDFWTFEALGGMSSI